jgi:hypothetical protein
MARDLNGKEILATRAPLMARCVGLVGLLLFGGLLSAGPVQPRAYSLERVDPFASKYFTDLYEGGQPAKAIVVGDGRTYLGLYAYDPDGNCVAHDDLGSFSTRDDRVIEWFVPETRRYTVEVRNLGRSLNQFEIAFK